MSIIGDLYLALPSDEWVDQAVCASIDPELFFPERGESSRAAKRICIYSCPVRAECLKSAMENDERYGVFGGFSERDRVRLKKMQNPMRPAHVGTGYRTNGHPIACKCFGCRKRSA